MTELVRPNQSSGIALRPTGAGVDPSTYATRPLGEWDSLDRFPGDAMRSLRRQHLMPADVLTGGADPIHGDSPEGAGSMRGWLIGSDALTIFDAVRTGPIGAWVVTGERRQFRELAIRARRMVAQDPKPDGAGGRPTDAAHGHAGLEIARSLPATARMKLLAVGAPTFASSSIIFFTNSTGLFGHQVIAVACNGVEVVAVLGNLTIQGSSRKPASASADSLARADGDLTIIRGILAKEISAH